MKRPRSKQNEWKKIMRAESFSLYQNRSQASRWRISWNDPAGKRHREKLWAESLEEATAKAKDLVAGVDPVKPVTVPQEDDETEENGPLVLDAFDQALAATRRGDRSRKDWEIVQNRFIAWLAEHHPQATHWRKITRAIIRGYMAPMKDNAPNTVRLALNPIVQTAGYMEREYSLPNVTSRLGLSSKLKKTPPIVLLADVVNLLDYIRTQTPRLEVGAALQGLCGLQLQEATRLTWDKVDLKRGLVEISGQVKNEYRNRVIPVPARALEALKRADELRAMRKVREVGPEAVIVSKEGLAYGPGSWWNYSQELGKLIRAWNAKVSWAPKDLRNCLPTFSQIEGLHSDLWEQYIGHAPRTVTGRHYLPRLAAATQGERELLDRQMDLFRKLVIGPIDTQISSVAQKWHEGAGTKKETATVGSAGC